MRFLLSLSLLLGLSLTLRADEIQLLPESLILNGPEASHRLIVQSKANNSLGQQITEGVILTSSDPNIAEVIDGMVVPKSDGDDNDHCDRR